MSTDSRLRSKKTNIAIVVLVLIVAGVAGWLLYDKWQQQKPQEKQQSADQAKTITSFDECVAAGNPVMELYPEQCAANGKTFVNDKQKAPAGPTADETASWLLYEPPGKEYSVRLADGWQLERYQQSSSLYAVNNEKLALQSGTKATVEQVEGGKDAITGFFFNYATQNIEQIVTEGAKQASLKTTDGLEIEKYYYVEQNGEQIMGMQKGDMRYTYVIRNSANRVIVANYIFSPGDADYHETVEKVLKTAHFN